MQQGHLGFATKDAGHLSTSTSASTTSTTSTLKSTSTSTTTTADGVAYMASTPSFNRPGERFRVYSPCTAPQPGLNEAMQTAMLPISRCSGRDGRQRTVW
ncbi:uncharacterized protein UV8b_02592 [Ustilaginoidea virens]|uniref:Uncharacterized protein n=1 Tax=Ustilaginoidea virens TaxID=1159556 RepID=A0A8E5MG88_USTVR|nr:uncharacterized protein UV8b_02592 [Ustilaginoidea virens]QUC18351.1 hypothetical protein UV8b_02592 [Ustilaginoidea virens]